MTKRAASVRPYPKDIPKKAKNPKRADRRRTIARFTTAILRAGGSNAFIARDGLGYRKAGPATWNRASRRRHFADAQTRGAQRVDSAQFGISRDPGV
jgi:hypothetical protein